MKLPSALITLLLTFTIHNSQSTIHNSCPADRLPTLHTISVYQAPAYHSLTVTLTLADGFQIVDGIQFTRTAADPTWRTSAEPSQQATNCRDQYAAFIHYTTEMLNTAQPPFAYPQDTAAYDVLLLTQWAIHAPHQLHLPIAMSNWQ